MTDIFKQAEGCISPALIEHFFRTKDSKWNKGEYWTLSPLRKDENVKSGTFSISESGLWYDLATQEKGNFLQLVSKAYGLNLREAAEKIIESSGGFVEKKEIIKDKAKKAPAIIPIPSGKETELKNVVGSKYNFDNYGNPVKIYIYKDFNGGSVLCVCRYEKENLETGKIEKSHIPYYYSEKGWRPGRPPEVKIPLYGEQRLKDNDLPVIIVEGEKCANVKVDGFVLISWIGGAAGAHKQDWKILKDKKVIIWPDNDEAGINASIEIKKKITHAKILEVEKLNKPEKWDIFDAVEENFDLYEFINDGEKNVPVTPYETFMTIIDDCYGGENIAQFDGIYYLYDEKKHCWHERLQINFESDIQTWISKNHIDFLKSNQMAEHTFVSNTASFLKRFQQRFYNGNPFKDSAIQPFLHFQNGAIEIKDKEYLWHNRIEKGESFFRNLYPLFCLDFDFDVSLIDNLNLEKNAPAFNYYLKSLVPKSMDYDNESKLTIDFFSQVLAYCLSPIKKNPYFFALYGGQGSGKSFFVELLEDIIGAEFILNRRTTDMDNRFASSDLWGSKIFVDDDVKSNLKLPDDFIKNYSGERSITIEKKNKDSIKGVKISCAMFFISNHSFTVSGGVEGIERRLIYIPYKKKIENPDVFLRDKIKGEYKKGKESGEFKGLKFDERPAMIALALKGLELFFKNEYKFIMPNWIAKEREQWLRTSNTVTQFLHEEIYSGKTNLFTPKELYNRYKDYCDQEDRKAYGRNSFYEKIKLENRIDFAHLRDGDIIKIDID